MSRTSSLYILPYTRLPIHSSVRRCIAPPHARVNMCLFHKYIYQETVYPHLNIIIIGVLFSSSSSSFFSLSFSFSFSFLLSPSLSLSLPPPFRLLLPTSFFSLEFYSCAPVLLHFYLNGHLTEHLPARPVTNLCEHCAHASVLLLPARTNTYVLVTLFFISTTEKSSTVKVDHVCHKTLARTHAHTFIFAI